MKRNSINIDKENKIHFWSIFTTAIVGLFSLWLGITIQDDINTKNALETQKLARYQMVEAIFPKFEQFIDTSGLVFLEFFKIYESEVDNNKAELAGDFYLHNKEKVYQVMLNAANFVSNSKYYFDGEAQEMLCKNNVAITFGLHLIYPNNTNLLEFIKQWKDCKNINDSIIVELNNSVYTTDMISYRKQVEKEMCKKVNALFKTIRQNDGDTNLIVNSVVHDFIFLPYIENFNIYSNELSPTSISRHLVKHITILLICIILGLCVFLLLLRFVFDVRIFIQKETIEDHCLTHNEISANR